jgi:hypothetical protein
VQPMQTAGELLDTGPSNVGQAFQPAGSPDFPVRPRATGKSPQQADKNVCPTQAALRHRWRTSEFRLSVSTDLNDRCALCDSERIRPKHSCAFHKVSRFSWRPGAGLGLATFCTDSTRRPVAGDRLQFRLVDPRAVGLRSARADLRRGGDASRLRAGRARCCRGAS